MVKSARGGSADANRTLRAGAIVDRAGGERRLSIERRVQASWRGVSAAPVTHGPRRSLAGGKRSVGVGGPRQQEVADPRSLPATPPGINQFGGRKLRPASLMVKRATNEKLICSFIIPEEVAKSGVTGKAT